MIEILLIKYKNMEVKTLVIRSKKRNRSFSKNLYIQKKPGKKLIFHVINLMNKYPIIFSYLDVDDYMFERLGGKILWRVEYEE